MAKGFWNVVDKKKQNILHPLPYNFYNSITQWNHILRMAKLKTFNFQPFEVFGCFWASDIRFSAARVFSDYVVDNLEAWYT